MLLRLLLVKNTNKWIIITMIFTLCPTFFKAIAALYYRHAVPLYF